MGSLLSIVLLLAVTDSALTIFRLMLFSVGVFFRLYWHRKCYGSQKYVYISTRFPVTSPYTHCKMRSKLFATVCFCFLLIITHNTAYTVHGIASSTIAIFSVFVYISTCSFVLLSLSLWSFFNFSIFVSLFAKKDLWPLSAELNKKIEKLWIHSHKTCKKSDTERVS